MTKEKIQSLTRYAQDLKNRLSSPTPKKHEGHPETYKQFLNNELSIVTAKLDEAKLEGPKK